MRLFKLIVTRASGGILVEFLYQLLFSSFSRIKPLNKDKISKDDQSNIVIIIIKFVYLSVTN
jgi:hypothetical protein